MLFRSPTTQAQAANEIIELYTWWTDIYPNRLDPYDVSGWSEHCDLRRVTHADDGFIWEDRNDEEKAQTRKCLDSLQDLETQYREEDTEMLIRLINLRDSLWT